MTKMNSSLENSNPSSDRKHSYHLRSGTIESLVSPSNIQSPLKTMKGENIDKDSIRKITDDHIDALKVY